ncbi:MAG: hypothetical protein IPM38_12730 [Ignavibacteria bacterium]|nr:hypothetical protein [Ignavibacteria bacterium]
MITYLVVDKLPAEPGIYGAFNSKKELEKIISVKPMDILLLLSIPGYSSYRVAKGLYECFSGNTEIKKMYEIPDNVIGNPDLSDILTKNSIRINSHFLNKHYDIFNDILFDGVFKKENHLESILPKIKIQN